MTNVSDCCSPKWADFVGGGGGARKVVNSTQVDNVGDGQTANAELNEEDGKQQRPPFVDYQVHLVKNIAMAYGKEFASRSCELFERQCERWLDLSVLRAYFAVNNAYVARKLRLLCFPFDHRDWSLGAHLSLAGVHAQPSANVNALDLYIPSMAYITFLMLAMWLQLAGYAATQSDGATMQLQRLDIGKMLTHTLAWQASEVLACAFLLFIYDLYARLKFIELIALSGYKYVSIVLVLSANFAACSLGYYFLLVYMSVALGYFLLRTLGVRLFKEPPSLVIESNKATKSSKLKSIRKSMCDHKAQNIFKRLSARPQAKLLFSAAIKKPAIKLRANKSIKQKRQCNAKFNSKAMKKNLRAKFKTFYAYLRLFRIAFVKEHSRICYYEARDFNDYRRRRKQRFVFIFGYVTLQLLNVVLLTHQLRGPASSSFNA